MGFDEIHTLYLIMIIFMSQKTACVEPPPKTSLYIERRHAIKCLASSYSCIHELLQTCMLHVSLRHASMHSCDSETRCESSYTTNDLLLITYK